MAIFIPAINNNDEVRLFEVQCLVKENYEDELIITGNVDSNIIDAVQIAVSMIEFNVLKNFSMPYKYNRIHFHFTDGSFIKEGTSSGLGIIIALLTELKLLSLENNILATGEIDLYGNIYKVGGVDLKMKINLDNINTIIIPNQETKQNIGKKLFKISSIIELFNINFNGEKNERIHI